MKAHIGFSPKELNPKTILEVRYAPVFFLDHMRRCCFHFSFFFREHVVTMTESSYRRWSVAALSFLAGTVAVVSWSSSVGIMIMRSDDAAGCCSFIVIKVGVQDSVVVDRGHPSPMLWRKMRWKWFRMPSGCNSESELVGSWCARQQWRNLPVSHRQCSLAVWLRVDPRKGGEMEKPFFVPAIVVVGGDPDGVDGRREFVGPWGSAGVATTR